MTPSSTAGPTMKATLIISLVTPVFNLFDEYFTEMQWRFHIMDVMFVDHIAGTACQTIGPF